ncbi:hypothetical protein CRG98_042686 [Punica granatum]|uniref:Uncharacterized protein n=1 Tax=Punica granatum TaxID=22663 RepID=A0A2I0HYZ7_PUNGR|nr:hypothetical protein CRG98_042686 [Punica granatum]
MANDNCNKILEIGTVHVRQDRGEEDDVTIKLKEMNNFSALYPQLRVIRGFVSDQQIREQIIGFGEGREWLYCFSSQWMTDPGKPGLEIQVGSFLLRVVHL